MLGRTIQLELPRRVVVYYLLFCLVAFAWLGAGVAWIAHSILDARTDNACRSLLSKAASVVTIDYLRHGDENLQSLVERFAAEGSLAYCAIVSPGGRYLAHSDKSLVGKNRRESPTSQHFSGDVEVIRFAGEDAEPIREYRAPIRAKEQLLGSLRVAVAAPGVWGTALVVAEHAPYAIVGPMLLVALGGFVLQRTARPLADVESQLRVAAAAEDVAQMPLDHVPVRSAAALGWNRVVDRLSSARHETSLDQRLGEAVRRLHENQLDDIADSLPDGLAVTDDQGRIKLANQALLALLGFDGDKEQIADHTMPALLGLSPDQQATHPLCDAAAQTRATFAEFRRPHAAGERVLRASRHPHRSSAGNASGHVWTVRDVTQQKLVEKTRDDFLNSATHELRTPLANIKAYAETLATSDLPDVEQQRQFCNTITSEATRLARFIDDLLSVSSMEAGSLSVNHQRVELDRLFNEVIDKVRPSMQQKQIQFDVLLPTKLPPTKLDKDKFAVALINLLGNAAKYTPAGGRVALKVRVQESQLIIEVEDSGVGIADHEVPRVFEKFFRSQDNRVQEQSGSGLGLALAQEVIRLHGGTIAVESELNKGSTFTVKLPLKKD